MPKMDGFDPIDDVKEEEDQQEDDQQEENKATDSEPQVTENDKEASGDDRPNQVEQQ
jgi:hypothetical protein